MLIKNGYIKNAINYAIKAHNDFYLKDGETSIPMIDDSTQEVPDEILSRLKNFRLNLDLNLISQKDIGIVLKDLSDVLKKMNLNSFGLSIDNPNNKESIITDTSFIDSLNDTISSIQISGIDFSKENPEIFSKFTNLAALGLENANLTDLSIFSGVGENVGIDVSYNPLEQSYSNEIVKEIRRHNGRFEFSDLGGIYHNIALALMSEEMKIDLTAITIPPDKVDEFVEILNGLQDMSFITNEYITNLLNSGKEKINFENATLVNELTISSTSEIDLDYLIDCQTIDSIRIKDLNNPGWYGQEEPYTREEFIKIKQEIKKIKDQVNIPDMEDSDREKKIFMQVYTILGKKINYDFYAISDEGEKDERLQITCRNLLGGLLENKCVCAGYADILKNVLSEFGIKAEYIERPPEDVEKYAEMMGHEEESSLNELLGFDNIDVKEFAEMHGYQDKVGHAWNSVILDGKKYLCDLTWDADSIKLEQYPLGFCCPSLEEFNTTSSVFGILTHDMFETVQEGNISEFSSEDQLRFLGYTEEEIDKKLHPHVEDLIGMIESMKKLENCASSISSEIKASDFDGIERSFTNEREVMDNDRTNQ